jgi:hypothetical protein
VANFVCSLSGAYVNLDLVAALKPVPDGERIVAYLCLNDSGEALAKVDAQVIKDALEEMLDMRLTARVGR